MITVLAQLALVELQGKPLLNLITNIMISCLHKTLSINYKFMEVKLWQKKLN